MNDIIELMLPLVFAKSVHHVQNGLARILLAVESKYYELKFGSIFRNLQFPQQQFSWKVTSPGLIILKLDSFCEQQMTQN